MSYAEIPARTPRCTNACLRPCSAFRWRKATRARMGCLSFSERIAATTLSPRPRMTSWRPTRHSSDDEATSASRMPCLIARTNELLVGELFDAGAAGFRFLLKSDTNLHLIAAIDIVSPHICAPSFLGLGHAVPPGRGTPEPITGRHRQVVQSIAEGYTNKATVGILNISPKTVATRRAAGMLKRNLSLSAALPQYALLPVRIERNSRQHMRNIRRA